MDDGKFALDTLSRAAAENINSHREILSSFPREDARDPYWLRLSSLLNPTPIDSRDLIIQVMRQTSTDVVASFSAIIDGSGYSDSKGLSLVDDNGDDIQGNLSNIFLPQAESI